MDEVKLETIITDEKMMRYDETDARDVISTQI